MKTLKNYLFVCDKIDHSRLLSDYGALAIAAEDAPLQLNGRCVAIVADNVKSAFAIYQNYCAQSNIYYSGADGCTLLDTAIKQMANKSSQTKILQAFAETLGNKFFRVEYLRAMDDAGATRGQLGAACRDMLQFASDTERIDIQVYVRKFGCGLSAMIEEADKERREQNRRDGLKLAANNLRSALDNGNEAEAAAYADNVQRLLRQSTGELMAARLSQPLTLDVVEELYNRPDKDLHTGLEIQPAPTYKRRKDESLEIVFPSGALSVIAAIRAHGKTTTLLSLCRQAAQAHPDKVFYYVSFEEEAARLSAKMMRSAAQCKEKELREAAKADNLRKFLSNRSAGDLSNVHIVRWMNTRTEQANIETLRDAFNYVDMSNAGGVFVDYLQRCNSEADNLREVMAAVCQTLEDIAVTFDIPVIAGSQMSRKVVNPACLVTQNVAESTFIEQVAANLYSLWYCARECRQSNDSGDKMGRIAADFPELFDVACKDQTTANQRLYCAVLKNRNAIGAREGVEGLLYCDMSTITVCSVPDEPKEQTIIR